jgi:protein-S-isoprenylcysteine O-methyltransferase Ste14
MPVSAYIQSIVFLIVAAVALFGSAGTLAITSFWLFLAILAAFTTATLLIIDPDLIRERMRPGGKRPPLGLQLVGIVPVLQWIIAGLDRGRLHWSDGVAPWLQAVGLIGVAAGFALCFWAVVVNPFFSSVARIQADRGQRLITAGPYGYVRHPGYSGAILLIVASGLALGSWIAEAMLIVVAMPLLFWRTIGEDRLLRAELPGYVDYASRVRWRVLPGIW